MPRTRDGGRTEEDFLKDLMIMWREIMNPNPKATEFIQKATHHTQYSVYCTRVIVPRNDETITIFFPFK